jgi:predicted permease
LETILTSVVPLFSVIIVGYAAGKLSVIDRDGVRTLVAFVFTLAMPALIFRMMATADFGGGSEWLVVLAYFLAQVPIFVAGLMIGGWWLRQSLSEMTIQAFGSSFSNGVVLGLPLVLSLYGDKAGLPALLIIVLDILIFGLITLLLEIGKVREKRGVRPRMAPMALDLVRSVGSNPLILASVLGIALGQSSWDLPGAVNKTLDFIGQAGPPAGLFALGATLSQSRIAGSLKPVAAMILMKNAWHPMLAWLMISTLFELDVVAASVVLIFAACPVGANVYVFAAQYDAGMETSATAILLSTLLAMATLSSLAVLLT